MDAEEVYRHHEIFKKYDIDDFKGYFKKMEKLADKHRYVFSCDNLVKLHEVAVLCHEDVLSCR